MLDQLVITPEVLDKYGRIVERKLNSPPLYFNDRIKDKHAKRGGVLSLEGTISTEAVEGFLAAYFAVGEALQSQPIPENIAEPYALFVAAAFAYSSISSHVSDEGVFRGNVALPSAKNDELKISMLVDQYLKGTVLCSTGRALAQHTKGYFARLRNIAEQSLQSCNLEDLSRHEVLIGRMKFQGLQYTAASNASTQPSEIVSLSDIGGNSAIKEDISLLIRAFKDPQNKKLGYQPPRGILFYGPPGTGKTMMAKAIACEIGLPFHYCDLSDMLSKWYGESEKNMRDFLAREGVLFFDEFDSIGKPSANANESSTRLINIISESMDGYNSNPNTLYIAATNDIQLDPKLKRAGRFSRFYFFKIPHADEIREILQIHVGKKQSDAEVPVFNGVDLNRIAQLLERKSFEVNKLNPRLGVVGADIREIVRRAHEKRYFEYLKSGRFVAVGDEDFQAVIDSYELAVRA